MLVYKITLHLLNFHVEISGPIGPRKKPAGQNTAIIAPWTENGASSLVPQPSSSPVVSSIFLRDGLREGLREPYDTYTAIPPPVMEALKEDQYARYSIENRSPSNMTSEYPLEQASSYENVYEQYHDPEGHYNGARTQQQQQQQQQIIGPFDSIRPPLYVGPSSYSMNRVVDHQLEHPMDLNGDLIHEPCDQRVEQGFDQSYDQSFAQPYDQQFDPAALKQQPSQQIMGGQQHQIDMLVQQFQQQSMQSLPQYPSVHQMQLQQQRQLPQTHLQQQQPPQQQPQQQPPPQQQQQPSQQPQQQQQMSMHMYQQQQLGPQGQAVVVIGGQRNVSCLPGHFIVIVFYSTFCANVCVIYILDYWGGWHHAIYVAGSTVRTSCSGGASSASTTTNATAATVYASAPNDSNVAANYSPFASIKFAPTFSQAYPNALTVFPAPISSAASCIPSNLGTTNAAVPLAAATNAAVAAVSAATAGAIATNASTVTSATGKPATYFPTSPAASDSATTTFNPGRTKQLGG